MPPKRTPTKTPTKAPPKAPPKVITERPQEDESQHALVLYGRLGPRLGVTSRDLVPYAKEHGGELILARNLTGPEKLRLKADSLSGSIRAPFTADELFGIVKPQLDQQLAAVERLHDPVFFQDDIAEYIDSRSDAPQKTAGKKKITDMTFIAAAIGSRIHNLYYMAASWKQVSLLLQELNAIAPGFRQEDVPRLFKAKDPTFMDRFVLLYRLVDVIVGVNQKNLALAAAASPHYAHYFESIGKAWMSFKTEEAMGAMKSLIDTIAMELVFPESEYSMHILFVCLNQCIEAAPKEGKRFTQRMFDAIGDLGVAVRLLDMLESALGGEWEKFRTMVPPYTAAFDIFIDAEYFSLKATSDMATIQQLVNPLSKTKDKGTLNRLWKNVNLLYSTISGFDIDKTWQLENDLKPTPQWSFEFPSKYFEDSSSEYADSDTEPTSKGALIKLASDRRKAAPQKAEQAGQLVKRKPGADNKKNIRKLTAGEQGYDSDDDVPPLVEASGSELGDSSAEDDDDDDDYDYDYDSDGESHFDSEVLEELSRLYKQAMNASDVFSDSGNNKPAFGPAVPPGFDEAKKPKKQNPFTKFMHQLAGRVFSANETLNSQRPPRATVPPKPSTKQKSTAAKAGADLNHNIREAKAPGLKAPRDDDDDSLPDLEPISFYTRAKDTKTKPTLEEVPDEDDDAKGKKRRGRKKGGPEPSAPSKSGSAAARKKGTTQPTMTAEEAAEYNAAFTYSTVSLHQPKAQSGHSYLASTGRLDTKAKPKTKVEALLDEPNKDSFTKKIANAFSRKKAPAGLINREPPKTIQEAPSNMPFKLGKRVKNVMLKVFADKETKSVKWSTFVKAMVAMGFSVDSSTYGSSVTFIPPDSKDSPIAFHKPHPDSTITPNMLHKFRARLARNYGWTEENFARFDHETEEVD